MLPSDLDTLVYGVVGEGDSLITVGRDVRAIPPLNMDVNAMLTIGVFLCKLNWRIFYSLSDNTLRCF